MKNINSLLLKLCVVCVLFIASMHARAQAYSLTTLSQTYTNLSGSTVVSPATWDEFTLGTEISIGFTFPFYTQSYTNIKVHTTGLSLPKIGIVGGGMDAFNTTLSSVGSGLSPISYQLSGTVGNRILKVEWKNALVSTTTETISAQIWIFENGTIEFHYGPNNVDPLIMGVTFVDLIEYVNNSATTIILVTGDPAAPTLDYVFGFLNSAPINGTVYRFTKNASDVKNTLAENVSLYPNPTTGQVTVSAPNISGIEVYNLMGEKVLSSLETTIDLSTQPDGIYLVKVQAGDAVFTEKVLKK